MPEVQEVIRCITDYADDKEILFTGSQVICGTGADIDICCVYSGRLSTALQRIGFKISPHEEYPNDNLNACYRRDSINIISMNSETLQRWRIATELAKLMNLVNKPARIVLFQYITEGRVRDSNIKDPLYYVSSF